MTRRRLRLWSYAAGALAVLVAVAVAELVVPRAGPPLPQSVMQAPPASGPVRILPLGASNTQGGEYGAYRPRLWELLTADGYEIDFVGSQSDGPDELPDRDHEGHRGWTIGMAEEQATGWVQEHDPDIVLVHIGANDLRQGASAQEAAASMDSLLSTLTAAKPEMTVVLSTLLPINEGEEVPWQQTNAAYADLAAEHAAAGERVMLADMSQGGPQADLIPDGVHPNGEGYDLMAEVWHPVVVEALARYTTPNGGTETGASADRCRWYAAAVRLARSIEGVDDPRAEEIRAELERLGITADSEPPAECEEDSAPAERDAEPERTEPERAPSDESEPAGGVGRIAYSADGNQHDEDDWASSAMTLAILAHSNLQPNLVHYTYNDHIWDSAPEHRRNMTASVMQGADRFGFDTSRFFDAADPQELEAGVQNLAREINRSGPGNELTLVLAGPMEVAWMALDAADPQARQYVRCVSHGDWNETHGADDHGGHSYEDLMEMGCQRDQPPDQNGELGKTGMSDWDYLNDLGANMQWLYSRIELLGNGDVSDAGMIYYVITGKETPTRSDLRSYFGGSD